MSKEVITFKADPALAELIKGVRNRSEFIRSAVLAALDSVCPSCQGTGVLTPHQKEHWEKLARDIEMKDCDDCDDKVAVVKKKRGRK